jgi:hypothetical protein
MVLHLNHAEGGSGVTFNDVTKDSAFYTTTSRFVAWLGAFFPERQGLWLPKDDLKDPSSWSSSLLLRDIHSKFLSDYNCKEASSQSQVNVGGSGGLSSQDGVSQQQEAAPLLIPQLNRLFETSFVRDENAVSNAAVTGIPSQHRVTQQILSHWKPFLDLKLMFAGSLRAEQLSLRSQQRMVATVEDSVLRMEVADLESQEEDAPKCILFSKPR